MATSDQPHFEAIDAVVASHPEHAALAPALRAAILRSEVLANLRADQGRAACEVTRRLRQLGARSPELRALWLLSFAGPLPPPALPLLERLAGWVRRPQAS